MQVDTKKRRGPARIVPGVPSPPCYFLEGKLSRGAGLLSMHLPRPPLPKASCEARSGSIFAHVSRATTAHQGTSYWIAARTISRTRAATCSTYYPLLSSFLGLDSGCWFYFKTTAVSQRVRMLSLRFSRPSSGRSIRKILTIESQVISL